MLHEILHSTTSWLLQPVIFCLAIIAIAAIWETGMSIGERFGGLQRLAASNDFKKVDYLARRRIERVDTIARIAPMLGLMGTLIPLGPGLAALGEGDVSILAQSVTIAFDTTVLGLFAGILGFVLSRMRRRWYDRLLDEMEGRT